MTSKKTVDRTLDRRYDGPFGAFKTGQYDREDGREPRELTGDEIIDRIYLRAYRGSEQK